MIQTKENSIEDAIAQLNKGDLIQVKWKPFFRLFGRDTFIGEYSESDSKTQVMTVIKTSFDKFDIKYESPIAMQYKRIEKITKLEPKPIYEKNN